MNSTGKLEFGLEVRRKLENIFDRLEAVYGDLKWWPAESTEEMVIGAILVQNVSWKNTERALANLMSTGLLNFSRIHFADEETIAREIVPTRFYNMKARRLKAFAKHLKERHKGSLDAMLHQPLPQLRTELLCIPGVGRETADDIILYGAGLPSFVVDAYTRRILSRCGLIPPQVDYEELRAWFMYHLPNETRLFNQYHALLDRVGNRLCLNKHPRCRECPLCEICTYSKEMGMNCSVSPSPG